MRLLRYAIPTVLLVLASSSAGAAGINLSWVDCGNNGLPDAPWRLGGGAFSCNTNSNDPGSTSTLFGSYVLENPLANLVGVEATLDYQTSGGTLAPWWDFDPNPADPGCRAGQLDFAFRSNATSCTDWPGSAPVAGTLAVQTCFNGADRARMLLVAAYAGGVAQPAAAGPEYVAFRLTINNGKTLGDDSCPGCSGGVCLLFRSLKIVQSPAQPTPMVLTLYADRNYVTWRGGNSECPQADAGGFFNCFVPVVRSTWGQVKGMYR